MTTRKTLLFYAWVACVGGLFSLYVFYPQSFHIESLRVAVETHVVIALGVYFILGSVRGFTLLPLTPLLLAGVVLFDPVPLLLVTLAGVVVSSSIVYYWSRYLGFDQYFESHYPGPLHRVKRALQRNDILVIALWAFFPGTPTDLICYACEILGIKLWRCLLGVGIGEGVICALYIWGGSSLLGIFY
jgi:uncharacterized membrane protein YdjX (TVP38/TMEM64 family)